MPNVIDLTDEEEKDTPQPQAASSSRASRLPRYDREIIDLSADSSPLTSTNAPQPPPRERSPDVEFVSERPRSRPSLQPPSRPHSRLTAERTERRHTPYQPQPRPHLPSLQNQFFDLTATDNDDDVVHVSTRQRVGGGINLPPPHLGSHVRHEGTPPVDLAGFGIARLARHINIENRILATARLVRRQREFQNLHEGRLPANGHLERRFLGLLPPMGPANDFVAEVEDLDEDQDVIFIRGQHRQHPQIRLGLPGGGLDYAAVGFQLGLPDEPPARPATPPYEAPPPPPAGFTRSPTEDEEVVCPNCGDELAQGETEEKRQVWVIKGCGHVYCGTCIANRTRRRSDKAKGKAKEGVVLPKPFAQCVVEGCGNKITPKKPLQVFI